jgi:polyisoprenoid-binding protein YceI
MNNLLHVVFDSEKKQLMLLVFCLLLLISMPVKALDLQCKLIENVQFNPSILAPMWDAANNGYLYRIQVDTSNVSFAVNHFPFSSVEGTFNEFEGGLALPEEVAKSKQALFIIKVASVATGDDDLNDYIKSSAFFNAEQFPVIIFVSTGFEWINKSSAQLVGNLTLHGVTRPLIFTVVIDNTENDTSSKNEKLTMQASAEINRSDFGMHGLQMLVSDTVRFNLKIEAYRVPG